MVNCITDIEYIRSPIIRAAQLAKLVHNGQTRKYNGMPYIVHPARVAGMMATHRWATDDSVCAAYLHDTLEDTELRPDDILSLFNSMVLSLVQQVTNPSKGLRLPRAQRKAMDLEHLRNAGITAMTIKLFDRIDNINDMAMCDDPQFKKLYFQESFALVKVIGDANHELTCQLLSLLK